MLSGSTLKVGGGFYAVLYCLVGSFYGVEADSESGERDWSVRIRQRQRLTSFDIAVDTSYHTHVPTSLNARTYIQHTYSTDILHR